MNSGQYIFESIKKFLYENNLISESWNALNVLIQNASTIGAIDLGFYQIKKSNNFDFFTNLKKQKYKLLYFLGSDNLDFSKKNEFVIYQGSHGDRIAQIADIILPSPAFTEQNGLFINLEGRLQKSVKSSYPLNNAKEDWKIFNLLSNNLAKEDLFKNFKELRDNTLKLIGNHSILDQLPKVKISKFDSPIPEFIDENILIKEIDYYFSNSIARSSKTMSDCRSVRAKNFEQKTGS